MSTPNPPRVTYRFIIDLPPELSPLPNASELPPVPFERNAQNAVRTTGVTNTGSLVLSGTGGQAPASVSTTSTSALNNR
ncbi:hypothetical protein NP233_g3 [Leucocoprinus birnbaumii]|uniref:Uncharacterized protein n=1 Tax=Leucocoprinus birnbaumii TaxID=56174 RepID=A0AAD5W2S2_9AGAR|nr:hypothetical protein NP233_g3 [Leucocoprinus birnbaumii]